MSYTANHHCHDQNYQPFACCVQCLQLCPSRPQTPGRSPWRNAPAALPLPRRSCVCFTNHALDQFLEGILDAGVAGAGTGGIIRVGGRCDASFVLLRTATAYDQRHARTEPATDKEG